MQALILAASLVAPMPREAGLLTVPDLDTLHRHFLLDERAARTIYQRGVYVERVEIGGSEQNNRRVIRSGPHHLLTQNFVAGEWAGQTIRLKVRPEGLLKDRLLVSAWVLK